MVRRLTRDQLAALHAAKIHGGNLTKREAKLNREAEEVGAAIHAANEEAIRKNDAIIRGRRNP